MNITRYLLESPSRKLNRLSTRAPSSGKFWCNCCDAQKVGQQEKCTNCGNVAGRKGALRRGELS